MFNIKPKAKHQIFIRMDEQKYTNTLFIKKKCITLHPD